jgi:excisionase family DNA binding protein
MTKPRTKVPLTTGGAARVLGVSSRRVQQLDAAGVLESIRTSGGDRLFDPDQVETVRQHREIKKTLERRLRGARE